VKYQKPALTFDQQADQLIERGLVCDREELLSRLKSVSYYRLSGYWYPSAAPTTRSQRARLSTRYGVATVSIATSALSFWMPSSALRSAFA
jgi:abortive infection bacteriophage resistance protein